MNALHRAEAEESGAVIVTQCAACGRLMEAHESTAWIEQQGADETWHLWAFGVAVRRRLLVHAACASAAAAEPDQAPSPTFSEREIQAMRAAVSVPPGRSIFPDGLFRLVVGDEVHVVDAGGNVVRVERLRWRDTR